MYIIYDKHENRYKLSGSIKVVSEITKISVHSLYNTFSREGFERYENRYYLIIKSEVIRSKREKTKENGGD